MILDHSVVLRFFVGKWKVAILGAGVAYGTV